MTHGVLGLIVCPMVDDNLVYSLGKDPEEKNILIVDNEHNGSIKRKLDHDGTGYEIIDWKDVLSRNYVLDGNRFTIVVYMIDLGLHSKPDLLKSKVEELAKEVERLCPLKQST